MKIKAEWLSYLHSIRQREIELIFSKCPPKAFEHGLEVGAGDGFQSTLLTKYMVNLTCTDYNPNRLARSDTESIKYMICDAENVAAYFSEGQFDIIFSSSVLEHLPYLNRALKGMHTILKDEGIMVHVVPSRFWKLGHMLLFNPNRLVTKLERMTGVGPSNPHRAKPSESMGNNPKMPDRPRRSRLWPVPHGAHTNNLEEFRAFGRAKWDWAFNKAGFAINKSMRGQVASGYGFGLDPLRNLLEQLGISSFYTYIVTKHGRNSPYRAYFL